VIKTSDLKKLGLSGSPLVQRPALRPWLLAARPKTLTAGAVPVVVGTAFACADGPRIAWSLFTFALLGAIFIQIATNFINDALDFRKGADTADRIGPLRVTQAGLLTPEAVLRGAAVCFLLAILCGVPLVLRGGFPLLVIGLASVAAAYAYTGGPYPLAYHGLGELFVMVFFGLVAVGGSYYVQTGKMTPAVIAAGGAVGSISTALLAVNNLRDLDHDRRSGKRTLAARFGARFAKSEITFFALVPFLLLAPIGWRYRSLVLFLPLLALPLALRLAILARRLSGKELNRCLGMSAGLLTAFGCLLSVALLLR
jgi:1,4-dihydroxy-2-naphthoate octaprenyltransferase